MLDWHEWTATGDPPPEDERLLFAECIVSVRPKPTWVVGTAVYVEDLDLCSADLRLSRCPGDTWQGMIYWAQFNLPD